MPAKYLSTTSFGLTFPPLVVSDGSSQTSPQQTKLYGFNSSDDAEYWRIASAASFAIGAKSSTANVCPSPDFDSSTCLTHGHWPFLPAKYRSAVACLDAHSIVQNVCLQSRQPPDTVEDGYSEESFASILKRSSEWSPAGFTFSMLTVSSSQNQPLGRAGLAYPLLHVSELDSAGASCPVTNATPNTLMPLLASII